MPIHWTCAKTYGHVRDRTEIKLKQVKQNQFELHKPNKAITSSSMMRSMIILICAVGWIWLVKRRMMQDNKNIF